MIRHPPSGIQKPRVLVGLSGGVDSSVAAALLVEQGYDVVGGFIKNWSDTKDLWTGECQWRGERRDALRVAAKLNIPLLTFDFEAAYRTLVLERMFREYEQGLTPNPDVLCNEEIKFGLFFEEAMRRGFDFVATGHYARVSHEGQEGFDGTHNLTDRTNGEPGATAHLLKGCDPDKDQSYFLHRISRDVLRRTLFPIGHLKKTEVRRIAEDRGLPTAAKPDSQGICFVGKLDMKDFLRKKIEPSPGDIVTPEGETVGRHDGLDAYTIGQRQGIGVSKDGRAWYVAGKDREANRLIVVPDREHPMLYRTDVPLIDVHWINQPQDLPVEVAVRYRQPPVPARLINLSPQAASLSFFQPVWAVAPGQSAVIYCGDECLGGGVIAEETLHFAQHGTAQPREA